MLLNENLSWSLALLVFISLVIIIYVNGRDFIDPVSCVVWPLLSLSFNMGGKEPIPFTIKGPTSLQLIDSASDSTTRKAGGAIMEIIFQSPTQIGEVTLTNYYTAWISIYVKRAVAKNVNTPTKPSNTEPSSRPRPHFERSISVDLSGSDLRNRKFHDPVGNTDLFALETLHSNTVSNPGSSRRRHSSGPHSTDLSDKPWECCISMKILMPCPHFETGCQDIFSIPATESSVELRDVILMRIILYQPSTVWKQFSIEDINVYRHLPKRGLSQNEEVSRQREGWLATLRLNTKKMLGGQLVEADKYESDEGDP